MQTALAVLQLTDIAKIHEAVEPKVIERARALLRGLRQRDGSFTTSAC